MTRGNAGTPIRLGIVGTGWGANHARAAAELAPLVHVTALCARRLDRLAALGHELGLPATALERDWQRLVTRSDVDLVVVTAPDDLHRPIVLAAVQAGKHVFCDKPLALTAAQAEEMVRAASAAAVQHFTGFTWRFAPPVATLHRLVAHGELGVLHALDAHFRIGPPLPGKEWQSEPARRSGGVFSNLGVHLVDLVKYFAEAESTGSAPPPPAGWRVWATGTAGVPANRPQHELAGPADQNQSHPAYTTASMQLEIPRDAPGERRLYARLQASQQVTLRAADPVRVEVHGEHATALGYANPLRPHTQRVDRLAHTSASREAVALDYPGGPPAPPTAALPSGGLLRPTIRHLYAAHIVPALTGGRPAPGTPTFWDGFVAQQVLDAALASAASGHWITL